MDINIYKNGLSDDAFDTLMKLNDFVYLNKRIYGEENLNIYNLKHTISFDIDQNNQQKELINV